VALLLGAVHLGCREQHADPHPSLHDTYSQIRGGMTRAEVESLLGPGRALTLSDDLALHIRDIPPGNSLVWQDGRTSITIAFHEGHSIAKLRAVAPATK
jgi:hypothetical protein